MGGGAVRGRSPEPLVPDAPAAGRRGSRSPPIRWRSGMRTEERLPARSWRSRELAPGPSEPGRSPMGVGRLDPARNGGISADGRLISLRHTEHGDILHHALMVLDAAGRRPDRDARRDPGSNLDPRAWSPLPGDDRLLFTSELERVRATRRSGTPRPASVATSRRSPGRRDPGGMVARRLRDRGPSRVRGRVRAPPGGSRQRPRRRSSPSSERRDHRSGGPARRSGVVPDERQRASRRAVVNAGRRGRPERPAANRRRAAARTGRSGSTTRRTTGAGVRGDASRRRTAPDRR